MTDKRKRVTVIIRDEDGHIPSDKLKKEPTKNKDGKDVNKA